MSEAQREPVARDSEPPPLVESLRREKDSFALEAEIQRKLAELNPAPKEKPAAGPRGVPWWLFLSSHVVVSSAVLLGPRPVGLTVLGVACVALVIRGLVRLIESYNARARSKDEEAATAAARLPPIEFNEAHATYLAGFRKSTGMVFFEDRRVVKVSEDEWQYASPKSCFIHLTEASYFFCRQHAESTSLATLVEVHAGLRKLGKLAAGPPA
ncbi:MAG: hypothetical protein HYZ53_07690 [Planctomycetes bacterium]|nr:hypothetical protein [Planctomycetota bacterium]